MRRGQFERAWQISDEILRRRAGKTCEHLPLAQRWLWRGEPLAASRVLVRCYHGLGDSIQFIRYARLVQALGAYVLVQCQNELIALLERSHDIDELVTLKDNVSPDQFDLEIEVMELPHAFRTTVQTIPKTVPYFEIEPATVSPGDELVVGLVWQAGEWDRRRSIPLKLIRTLEGIPGVSLHALQHGESLVQQSLGSIRDSGNPHILEAARIIAGLDLLISVDSMPAHLGGALGVPTWTLLHQDCDWRWMEDRIDSPWYPTMRLFRQTRAGDWVSVIEDVADELARLAYQFECGLDQVHPKSA